MPHGFRRTLRVLAGATMVTAALSTPARAAAPELMTTGPADGGSGYAAQFRAVIETNVGDEVMFSTRAALVPQDTDEAVDVYVRRNGTTTLLTPGTAEDVNVVDAAKDAESFVFLTTEPLVPNDADGGGLDLYVRTPKQTRAVSVAGAADTSSVVPEYGGASADFLNVAFQTPAALLPADGDVLEDVYELRNATLELTSANAAAAHITYAGISPTGVVAVETVGKLLPADTDGGTDVYTYDQGALSLRSKLAGAPNSNAEMRFAAFAPGSNEVLFSTKQAMTPSDTDKASDIYAHPAEKLVSTGSSGEKDISLVRARSATSVVVRTAAKLSADDADAAEDLYLYAGGSTSLLSSAAGEPQSDVAPAFVADAAGKTYFQTSERVTPADVDDGIDVYSGDAGGPTLVTAAPTGLPADPAAGLEGLSPDGGTQYISTAARWSANDDDGVSDVYRIAGGQVTLMTDATTVADPDEPVQFEAAGKDGRVYFSTNENMAANDTDGARDVYAGDGTQFVAPKPDPEPDPESPPGPGAPSPPVQPDPGPGSPAQVNPPIAPGPPPAPRPGPSADTRAPRFTRAVMRPSRLAARRLPALAKGRKLFLEIVLDEAATVQATVRHGSRRFTLKGRASADRKLRLRLSRAQARTWQRAARVGKAATVSITARDAAGNTATRRFKVRVA